jgi:hypothetical protein
MHPQGLGVPSDLQITGNSSATRVQKACSFFAFAAFASFAELSSAWYSSSVSV